MRIKEIIEPEYAPKINFYIDDDGLSDDDIKEIAGMIRGLYCSIEGWARLSGKVNDSFINDRKVSFEFSSVKNAHYFKICAEHYFSKHILEAIKLKRVKRSSR